MQTERSEKLVVDDYGHKVDCFAFTPAQGKKKAKCGILKKFYASGTDSLCEYCPFYKTTAQMEYELKRGENKCK